MSRPMRLDIVKSYGVLFTYLTSPVVISSSFISVIRSEFICKTLSKQSPLLSPSRLKYVWFVGHHKVVLSVVAVYSMSSSLSLSVYFTVNASSPGYPSSPSLLTYLNVIEFFVCLTISKGFLSKPHLPP